MVRQFVTKFSFYRIITKFLRIGLQCCDILWALLHFKNMSLNYQQLRLIFWLKKQSDFVQLHGDSQYLYSDDLNKVVVGNRNPKDYDLFKKFL
jgi:hypothetical protein